MGYVAYNFWKFAAMWITIVEFVLLFLPFLYLYLVLDEKTGLTWKFDYDEIPQEQDFKLFITVFLIGVAAGVVYLLMGCCLIFLCFSFSSRFAGRKSGVCEWLAGTTPSLIGVLVIPFSPFMSILNGIYYVILGYRLISIFIVVNWLRELSRKSKEIKTKKTNKLEMSKRQVHTVV